MSELELRPELRQRLEQRRYWAELEERRLPEEIEQGLARGAELDVELERLGLLEWRAKRVLCLK